MRKILPINVAIETNNNCNLRCPGCARTHKDFKAKNKIMSFKNFKKYFDMFPWNVCNIGLNGFGEPMLHPNIVDIVAYITENRPGMVVWFSTNLLANKMEAYDKVFEKGLHHMNISVDSLNPKEADIVRTGTDTKKLAERIEYVLRNHKDKINFSIVISRYNFNSFSGLTEKLIEMGAKRIVYTIIVPYGKDDVSLTEEQIQFVCKKADEFKPIVELGRKTDSGEYDEIKKPCMRLIKDIYINADGQLLPCCFFWASSLSLGDLNKKTIKEIFFSKEWLKRHKKLLKGEYPKFCGTFNEPAFCGAMHK